MITNQQPSLYLKEVTSRLHKQVEEHLGIMTDQFTLERYQDYLIFLSQFFLMNEDSLMNFSEQFPELELDKRQKHSLIQKDLAFFNIEIPASDSKALKVLLVSPDNLFGYLYVMEGATLGGKFIRKQLEKKFGAENISSAFLNCYGGESLIFWEKYKDCLNTRFNESDLTALGETAVQTFQKFLLFK